MWVYVTHSDVVIAIDADSGKANLAFAKGDHLHAAVPVPGTDLIVTTNSGDNTARIISAKDGRQLASIPTAKDADGAAYDPKSGLVVVICGDGGALTLIDPKAMKAVGTITIGNSLEFGQPDGKGQFFVNVVEPSASSGMTSSAARPAGMSSSRLGDGSPITLTIAECRAAASVMIPSNQSGTNRNVCSGACSNRDRLTC